MDHLTDGSFTCTDGVSLPAVIVAAVAGAIIGDAVGYEVGKQAAPWW